MNHESDRFSCAHTAANGRRRQELGGSGTDAPRIAWAVCAQNCCHAALLSGHGITGGFFAEKDGRGEALYEALGETNAPAVYLGAEVAYFPGISRYAQIRDLCIAGSRCILIEMPFDEWTTTVTDEIIALHECAGLLPVLAHIERYTYHERVLKNLLAHHVLIQSNSAFFYSFRTKRRALRMLKREEIHLLGSDCHNMHTRIPDLARCAEVIQKRCGEAFLPVLRRVWRDVAERRGSA